jgi:hypothetical protein
MEMSLVFKDYRGLFIAIGLLVVVTSVLAFAFVPQGGYSERYSELWLLGSGNMAENYPFNVGVGEEYSLTVGVSNHMDSSEDYLVSVKFGNSVQPLPDIESSVPSTLPPLVEYDFSLDDEGVWGSLVSFSFVDAIVEGDVLKVGDIVVNGLSITIDTSTSWDVKQEGYFFQLFFELWRYDVVSGSYRFDNRFVGLWLNMTA